MKKKIKKKINKENPNVNKKRKREIDSEIENEAACLTVTTSSHTSSRTSGHHSGQVKSGQTTSHGCYRIVSPAIQKIRQLYELNKSESEIGKSFENEKYSHVKSLISQVENKCSGEKLSEAKAVKNPISNNRFLDQNWSKQVQL